MSQEPSLNGHNGKVIDHQQTPALAEDVNDSATDAADDSSQAQEPEPHA
jgi:hypothetical protein